MYEKFEKDPFETVGEVNYKISIPWSVTNQGTDGQTYRWRDWQTGANLNAIWVSSQVHKKTYLKLISIHIMQLVHTQTSLHTYGIWMVGAQFH